jgi:hypothetical protein
VWLRRGEYDEVHYIHVWKSHNETYYCTQLTFGNKKGEPISVRLSEFNKYHRANSLKKIISKPLRLLRKMLHVE